jgi:excisionase family DNA binding protein
MFAAFATFFMLFVFGVLITPVMLPALIDVCAVAKLLNCSERHVYRLADAGRIPRPIKLGALVRWNRVQVEKWLADGCPATRSNRQK